MASRMYKIIKRKETNVVFRRKAIKNIFVQRKYQELIARDARPCRN